MGDSRGHWEGDTLVVETTNFTDKVAIGSNGAGYPGDPGYHSEALRLTERFTRTGENTLDYTARVDDPQTWTKPWTILIALTRSRDTAIYEYACHEGTTPCAISSAARVPTKRRSAHADSKRGGSSGASLTTHQTWLQGGWQRK
jgi:hypothetical protein